MPRGCTCAPGPSSTTTHHAGGAHAHETPHRPMLSAAECCCAYAYLVITSSQNNYFHVCGLLSPELRDPDTSPPGHGLRGVSAGGGGSLTSPEGGASVGSAAVALCGGVQVDMHCTCRGPLLLPAYACTCRGRPPPPPGDLPGTPGVKMDQGVIGGAERCHGACCTCGL